ncbi:hypothetical protein [Nannocystis exedens]|uniref:hypothetical protein n=1 Tax=Nannocystis exedens TaxID=54 RepID=UPI001B80D835|nr:hypothetical protein [Nannocystis exedens]
MPRAWTLLPLILLGAPATVRAEVGVADFSPLYERQLLGLDDFSYDSGWFPMDGPLQLRLVVHAGNSVEISMPGEGHYDWAEQAIRFVGAPEAGALRFDIGLQIDAKVRFDVLGLKWESDIIGPYDYAVLAEDFFTPYLLPGNPERPVVIDDETDPATVVAVPVTPDILVAAGNLNVDAYAILQGSLAGQAIEASADAPQPVFASVTEEGTLASLPAGAGPQPDPFLVDGALVCDLTASPTLVLKPTLVMEILGQEYEIADIEIPIELPPFAENIRFDAITMSFPRPAAVEPTTGADSEGDSHGMSGGEDEPTGGGAPETGSTGEDAPSSTDPDGPASGDHSAGGDDGCGCRSDGSSCSPGVLALLGLARRRRGRRG